MIIPKSARFGVLAAPLAALISCASDGSAAGPGASSASAETGAASQAITDTRARTSTRVAAGGHHSCVVDDQARVYCWGQNSDGQLGVDPAVTPSSTTPVLVPGLQHVLQVSAGDRHTCAVAADGQVWCWGANDRGQLGNGSATPAFVYVPSLIVGVFGVSGRYVQVAAGGQHTCAIRDVSGATTGTGGDVRCWGRGTEGQLGDGGGVDRYSPVTASFSYTGQVIDLAAGATHSCAVRYDGAFTCWGSNTDGELGDGTTTPALSPSFLPNPNLSGHVTDITAGDHFSCAVVDGGRVACWGRGTSGQLSTYYPLFGTPTSSLVPVYGAVQHAVSVSAGATHGCATLVDGGVTCWGANGSGQLGATAVRRLRGPVSAQLGDQRAVEVAAGGAHTCAAISNGTLRCWGDNAAGQVGNGSTTTPLPLPTSVATVTGASRQTTLASGYAHACAIRGDGFSECWGYNFSQQAGGPSTSGNVVATSQQTLVASRLRDIATGRFHSCGVTDTGDGVCWGRNVEGQLGNGASGAGTSTAPSTVTGVSQLVGIATGDAFSCGLRFDGAVYCWGDNSYGQLGNGSTASSPTPLAVTLPGPARKVVARTNGACALVAASPSVYCWGYGYMGDGATNASSVTSTPVGVVSAVAGVATNLDGAIDLAHGDRFACAITADGAVWCWGINSSGQLGVGTTIQANYAVQLPTSSIADVRGIATGANHTCAIRADGSLWCWGDNSYEELGLGGAPGGGSYGNQLSPMLVPPSTVASGVRQVTAGDGFTCAAMADQTVRCWGRNDHSQCGNTVAVLTPLAFPVVDFP
jgi:alpha-tubulin suppressor-like RCC1 family protein